MSCAHWRPRRLEQWARVHSNNSPFPLSARTEDANDEERDARHHDAEGSSRIRRVQRRHCVAPCLQARQDHALERLATVVSARWYQARKKCVHHRLDQIPAVGAERLDVPPSVPPHGEVHAGSSPHLPLCQQVLLGVDPRGGAIPMEGVQHAENNAVVLWDTAIGGMSVQNLANLQQPVEILPRLHQQASDVPFCGRRGDVVWEMLDMLSDENELFQETDLAHAFPIVPELSGQSRLLAPDHLQSC
mmetsp:Transcript_54546/g.152139  ORF Transcript_54546/g.152139 Transcript_54546/m.152139 type:complete len:246 (+) Transcript_54546:174-911(+)